MENQQISMMDLVIETHIRLTRQGPGSPEMTVKALSYIENIDKITRTADLGCGTGGQTMVLSQSVPGSIVGVDQIPDFISVFNDHAKRLNLEQRINGIVGEITDLAFAKEDFDLIWSEGAIDGVGFEKGLSHWHSFLKKDGYVAVTCPSWLTAEHPAEITRFWADADSRLDTISDNIGIMQKCGYRFVAAFTLPEECWTDNYFIHRKTADQALLRKYVGNKIVENYIENNRYESELFSKYNQHYGYVFYIGKKT